MARIVVTSPKPALLINTAPKPPMIDPAVLAAALGAEIFDGPHPLARPPMRSVLPSVPTTPSLPQPPAAAVTPPPVRPSA